MRGTEPTLEYLLACSKISLESFGLSRLNRASNLRKELSQVAEQWVAAEVSFRLARLIADRRDAGIPAPALPSSRPAMLSSGKQLTLPVPSEPTDGTPEANAMPAGPEKTGSRTKVERLRACAKGQSKDRAVGSGGKVPAVKVLTRSTPKYAVSRLKNVHRTDPLAERPRSPGPSTSLRAVTELRGLDKVASGAPEMHASSTFPVAESDLRFRRLAPAPVLALAQSCSKAGSDHPPGTHHQLLRPAPARPLAKRTVFQNTRGVVAS
jgi:hypothetical protein